MFAAAGTAATTVAAAGAQCTVARCAGGTTRFSVCHALQTAGVCLRQDERFQNCLTDTLVVGSKFLKCFPVGVGLASGVPGHSRGFAVASSSSKLLPEGKHGGRGAPMNHAADVWNFDAHAECYRGY